VSPKTAKPKVVREGYQVPTPVFDQKKTDFLLDQLDIVAPRQTPRVVSQSIPAGTRVTPGTVVDLILAPADDISFDIFTTPHADLRDKPVTFLIDTVLDNPQARQILLTYDRLEDVPEADKQVLRNEFTRHDITITEDEGERGLGRAWDSARGALAFR
jgi:hypothetical protein